MGSLAPDFTVVALRSADRLHPAAITRVRSPALTLIIHGGDPQGSDSAGAWCRGRFRRHVARSAAMRRERGTPSSGRTTTFFPSRFSGGTGASVKLEEVAGLIPP